MAPRSCLTALNDVLKRVAGDTASSDQIELGGQNIMKYFGRTLSAAAVIVMCVAVASAVSGDDGKQSAKDTNRYVVTNLTSNLRGVAPNTDPVLQNAWSVAFTPGASPFWIADNATGCSTLYDGTGLPAGGPPPLKVKIPLPGGAPSATSCQPVDPNANPP